MSAPTLPMTTTTLERTPAGADRVTTWSVAVLAALLLVPALAYAGTVLLPFLASDLDQLPLAELAGGAADPELPGDSRVLTLAGLAAVVLAPLGALLALGGSALQLLAVLPTDRRTVGPRVAGALAVVLVGSVVVLGWSLTPLGRALTTWQFD